MLKIESNTMRIKIKSIREFLGYSQNVTLQKSTLTLEQSKTLSSIFCGLFDIIKSIGLLPYEFKFPKDRKIHIVFHVSLLRKICIGS